MHAHAVLSSEVYPRWHPLLRDYLGSIFYGNTEYTPAPEPVGVRNQSWLTRYHDIQLTTHEGP